MFALAAVAVLGALLLGDSSPWKILATTWFVAWVATQVALQHYATRAGSTHEICPNLRAFFIMQAVKASAEADKMKIHNDNLLSDAGFPNHNSLPAGCDSSFGRHRSLKRFELNGEIAVNANKK